MELVYMRVFVTDFERALRFYTERVGLTATHADAAKGWAVFDTGSSSLAIERADPGGEAIIDLLPGLGQSLVGRFVGCYLEVSDIDATYQALLTRGVEFVEPPESMPWGGILAHFKDPDGNILTLLGGVD